MNIAHSDIAMAIHLRYICSPSSNSTQINPIHSNEKLNQSVSDPITCSLISSQLLHNTVKCSYQIMQTGKKPSKEAQLIESTLQICFILSKHVGTVEGGALSRRPPGCSG
ncbi:hypothetical protein AMECASPLE_020011 [Ameca splendens]|uniref:Uncharacterized protein n=1 Tax=Ameca splendens TaxID=208324 RepID=A0ABV0ZCB1_9TELE